MANGRKVMTTAPAASAARSLSSEPAGMAPARAGLDALAAPIG
jgi:hypothetical protein